MKIHFDVHIHIHPHTSAFEGKIMTSVAELAATLASVDTQLDKATAEILKSIQDLRIELANVTIPPAAEAALALLQTKVQALDDITPDEPIPAP